MLNSAQNITKRHAENSENSSASNYGIHQFPQSVGDWQSALYCWKSDISTQTRDSAAVFQPKRAPQTSSGVVYILWTLTKIGCLLVTWVRLFYIGSVTTAYGSSLGLGSPIYGLSLGSGITIYSLSLPYKVCHLGWELLYMVCHFLFGCHCWATSPTRT